MRPDASRASGAPADGAWCRLEGPVTSESLAAAGERGAAAAAEPAEGEEAATADGAWRLLEGPVTSECLAAAGERGAAEPAEGGEAATAVAELRQLKGLPVWTVGYEARFSDRL